MAHVSVNTFKRLFLRVQSFPLLQLCFLTNHVSHFFNAAEASDYIKVLGSVITIKPNAILLDFSFSKRNRKKVVVQHGNLPSLAARVAFFGILRISCRYALYQNTLSQDRNSHHQLLKMMFS